MPTFCGALSLRIVAAVGILKDALVAELLTVANEVAASFSSARAPRALGAAATWLNVWRACFWADFETEKSLSVTASSSRGRAMSTIHGDNSGAPPPRLGRAVERV